jgi:chaperonin GroES
MRFRPLDDRLIIKPLEVKTQTDSGIYLPDEAQEPADEGDVVAVGPGARIDGTDQRTTMAVNVGDRVRYGRYSGHEVLLDGEKFYCIKEDQVLMIESKPLMDILKTWAETGPQPEVPFASP